MLCVPPRPPRNSAANRRGSCASHRTVQASGCDRQSQFRRCRARWRAWRNRPATLQRADKGAYADGSRRIRETEPGGWWRAIARTALLICSSPAGKLDQESLLFTGHWPFLPRNCARMKFIDTVFQKLKRHPKRIVFPEGTEPRVLRAAARFVKLQLGAPIALGAKDEIEKIALHEHISLDHIGIVDPQTSSELPSFVSRLEKLK